MKQRKRKEALYQEVMHPTHGVWRNWHRLLPNKRITILMRASTGRRNP